ncbi:hypothetical protein HMPREF9081_0728 [Centipeda periodontii DSM 2778]|uniref:Uncharacterized protein n=1 Tax=Centipeda periodontii DSM 2778 TaxID=888060 RepID=F5RKE3_9FIRM|nr:hypothetical protein HMPREF9081_0728 [Centipeda periodontii DSM 2778]
MTTGLAFCFRACYDKTVPREENESRKGNMDTFANLILLEIRCFLFYRRRSFS